MKIVIDIDENMFNAIKVNQYTGSKSDIEYLICNGMPYEEYPFYQEAYQTGYEEGKNERPQRKREFIEILANYTPDDLCPYPEYRGKPYYSIRFRENGEEFEGYGTYSIEVLSRYLQDYFF